MTKEELRKALEERALECECDSVKGYIEGYENPEYIIVEGDSVHRYYEGSPIYYDSKEEAEEECEEGERVVDFLRYLSERGVL